MSTGPSRASHSLHTDLLQVHAYFVASFGERKLADMSQGMLGTPIGRELLKMWVKQRLGW